ncbi:MAG: transposase [Candidatus Sabulitectum sp.]|nr:transposase [Candidatus Sabulitectum sp.]
MREDWQALRESGIGVLEIAYDFNTSKTEVVRQTKPPKKKAKGYSDQFKKKAVAYYRENGIKSARKKYPKISQNVIYSWARNTETFDKHNYNNNAFKMPTSAAKLHDGVLALRCTV